MITGTAHAEPGSTEQALLAAAAPSINQMLERMGRECVREIADEAAATYRSGRVPARSRSTPKLSDPSAYDYDVTPMVGKNGGLDVHLAGGVSEGFKAKFFSLANGSVSHVIRARNAKTLAYNRDDPTSTQYNAFPKAVTHPGTSGSNFYERAIRRVMSRFR